MGYFRICPDCGAILDPGERCDCKTGEPKKKTVKTKAAAKKNSAPGTKTKK